jgi:succinoglycan biosynthesis protein ExoM
MHSSPFTAELEQTSLTHETENAMQSEAIELTVCICTFRRPSILSAIDSVAKQTVPPNISVRILVIDNDAEQSALNIVTEFRSRITVRLDYKHVPGQNISMARNAGLEAATTPWLVFMDDDEFASTNWLSGLIAGRNGANAVFGPCEAIYGEGTPDWIKQGDYHSNRITETEPITTGYTSNVLIDMAFVRRHRLRFALDLGRTGGEDTMFFRAMYRKGGVLKYASCAAVYETVVSSRANLAWVLRRRYRAGQIRALVSYRCDLIEYARLSLTAPFKVVVCVLMSALMIASRARAIWWLMRGVFHWGTISYALGIRVHEEYGKPT